MQRVLHARALFVAGTLLFLSGCLQSAIEPANKSPGPAFDGTMEMDNCRGIFHGRMPEFSELGPWLPPGFVGEDAGVLLAELLIDTGVLGRAFMAVTGVQCEEPHEQGWLAFWILVKEPNVPGFVYEEANRLHGFEVALYLENATATEQLTAAGMDIYALQAETMADITSLEGNELVSGIEFNGFAENKTVLQAVNFGTQSAYSLDNPMSTWQVTREGTHEFRSHIQANGKVGTGACASDFYWVNQFTNQCGDGYVLTGYVDEWILSGSFQFHEGQHPR